MQAGAKGRQALAKAPAVDEEPLDWKRYRKYDIFKDLLGAAAANPDAQVPTQPHGPACKSKL